MIKRIDTTKSRFRDALWFKSLEESKVPIIVGGVGGIGSWLILLLSRIVSSNTPIVIYDIDTVEEVNLAGQLYRVSDIGKKKTDSLKGIVKDFSKFNSITCKERYNETSFISPIMFSAFDNMKSRKDMFENWKKEVAKNPSGIFIDGRLLAEQLQVFFVTPDRIPLYEKYLYSDSEIPDASCSYKQTSHFAAAIAAKMVQGFTNWFIKDVAELPFMYEEIGGLFISTTKDE